VSVSIRATENFAKNLEQIQQFLGGEGSSRFDDVLDHLFGSVIANLALFPEMGYDFMARKPASYERAALAQTVRARLGADVSVRELVTGEHLVLYALSSDQIYLLTIRHHRQLSYDLRAHWLV
jgi:hypothetical protein